MRFTCKKCGERQYISLSPEVMERYALGENSRKLFSHLEHEETILVTTGMCLMCYEDSSLEEYEEFEQGLYSASQLM